MPQTHPTADELWDYASAVPTPGPDEIEDPQFTTDTGSDETRVVTHAGPRTPLARVAEHLRECVVCRVHLSRLREAPELTLADDAALTALLTQAPALPEAIRTFLVDGPDATPGVGEVWRAGDGAMLFLWVRKVLGAATVDVIPLVVDLEMADSESFVVDRDQTPLGVPLLALVTLRTHAHIEALNKKLGDLDISDRVEDILAVSREGRVQATSEAAPFMKGMQDPRREYQDALRDALSELAPSVWASQQRTAPAAFAADDLPPQQPSAATSPTVLADHEPSNSESAQARIQLGHALEERLGPSVRCLDCEPLSAQTGPGRFTAFAKVHYIDTSVLVVHYDHPSGWLPSPTETAAGVVSLLAIEMDVNAVAVTRPGPHEDAILLTRAAMRPALELPAGIRSEAVATYDGLTLTDCLVKYLDGEHAAWEVLDRDDHGLPHVDVAENARNHARVTIEGIRRSGARSSQPKKDVWTQVPDELAEAVAEFVVAAANDDYPAAMEILGIESE